MAILSVLLFAGVAIGAPTLVDRSTTVSIMSAGVISTYAPYASLASAAYCSTANTWTCAQCKNLPGFVPYATGGDGDSVPKWYVGWWPAQSTVVVGHQGTNPAQLSGQPFFIFVPRRVEFSQGMRSIIWRVVFYNHAVQVHDGFMKAQAATATTILAGVKSLLSAHSATKVLAIGHSLGGAIATLDALYFRINLPPTVSIKAVTFGLPRVGNQAFADLIDSQITDFSYVTNEKDLVPILPGEISTGRLHGMTPNSPGPPFQAVSSDMFTQAARNI
ncbi:lipase domain-containing protein [Rhizoctonia solani AG-1 IA]|uniref:Lipase domain-containing protein n=1 Tax=Thanatephorus cucumeris (strain AG1-IA) TaxID=983506 RepID=L8X435_THACA|nr:lipase domain-containing protein [Rhizoctonia solani AG-1 IA]